MVGVMPTNILGDKEAKSVRDPAIQNSVVGKPLKGGKKREEIKFNEETNSSSTSNKFQTPKTT